jgi:hypothetical protein
VLRASDLSFVMDFIDIIDTFALINKLLLFLVNAVGLELLLWAFATNRRTRPGQAFLLGAFFVLLWIDIDFVCAQAGEFFFLPAVAALWAFRGMYALLAIFFAAFHSFSLNFPAANPLDKNQRRKDNLGIAVWALFFALSFTSLIVKDVDFSQDLSAAAWISPGPLFWLYAVAAALTLGFSFFELSRNRRFADAQNRRKARFIALAAGIFGFFNLLFNIIGPALGELWGYIDFFALFADYIIVILLGYIVYYAARDKLYGIKIILVEIFVGLMGASLVVMAFFVGLLWQQALLLVLFVLFCVFGYVLIQSTIKEYREKELLEQKVAERTEELERAKVNLEETNLMLEARVRARTRELEKLNQTLEQKVVVRTNDLEAKIKDLETFQKITVGRELKMMEMKKEMEKLRADTGKTDSDK